MSPSPEPPDLPFVDEHSRPVAADPEQVWPALVAVADRSFSGPAVERVARLVGCRHTRPSGPRPLEEGSELAGFVVADVTPQRRLSLAGSHHFSTYRLVLGVRPDGPGRSVISAATRAEFPGAKGRLYRAAVIGTRGHVLVVNRMLAAIEQRSLHTGARE